MLGLRISKISKIREKLGSLDLTSVISISTYKYFEKVLWLVSYTYERQTDRWMSIEQTIEFSYMTSALEVVLFFCTYT